MTAIGPDAPGSWSWETVESILQTGCAAATSFTGGGSRAVSWMLNHPGASRVLVEAQIPYHPLAIDNYLGLPGPHRAVEETARRLAVVARQRAANFSGDARAVGLGASAALATDRERRGLDRAFITSRSGSRYEFVHLHFDKTVDRLAQEEVLSKSLLATLAKACCCPVATVEMPAWAHTESWAVAVDEAIEGLLDGIHAAIEIGQGTGASPVGRSTGRLFVPGSFNPFHGGHGGLADAAEKYSGREAGFELSVHNVDKPALPYREILGRVAQPRQGRALVLTREPTFLGKARVLAGCWFGIGYDTALRLVEPGYYDGTVAGMETALAELRDLDCRFYVAGRQWQGVYRGLDHVSVPRGFSDLFVPIPESEFRHDISSTALRQERT